MNEESEIRAKIEETARHVISEYQDLIEAGGTPTVVSFDSLFERILGQIKRDPRITDLSKKSLRAYAEQVYRDMCKQIGQSGMVGQKPEALRGLEIFLVAKVLPLMDDEYEVFADEAQAVGTFNNWLKALDIPVTAQQIQKWKDEPAETRGPHPLCGTKCSGSGVWKCAIR